MSEILNKSEFLARKKEEMIKTASSNSIGQRAYKSPYLSLSDLSIPDRMGDLFKWCKYFYTFDPLIHGAINSLSTFPITRLNLEESDEWIEKSRERNLKSEKDSPEKKESPMMKSVKYMLNFRIKIYKLLIEIGIDYFLYGNCFVFGEITTNADNEKEWKSVRRLSPSSIIIDSLPDGNVVYKWNPPDSLKRIVKNGEPKDALDRIPDIIKRAIKNNKSVIIDSSKIYHFKKPSDSLMDSAWGTPGIANVLKLLMYRNILRQAQEAVAREHIVPFRIFYLNPQSGFMPGQVGGWGGSTEGVQNPSDGLADQIAKATADPNYKVVSNVPVGMVTAGGHGRNLLLTQEIDQIQSEVLAGMNVPREFIFGGVSYSGSSISLKILENQFITYRLLLEDFINDFVIKGLAKARGEWRSEEDDKRLIKVSLTDLKMQDDIQQKQMILNLNAAGKVSDSFLLRTFGIDAKKMINEIKEEAKAKSEVEKSMMLMQVETETEMMKAKTIQQVIMQEFQTNFKAFTVQNQDYNVLNADIAKIISDVRDKMKPRDLKLFEYTQQNTQQVEEAKAQDMSEMAMTIVRSYKTSSEYGELMLNSVSSNLSKESYGALLYKIKEFVAVDPEVEVVEGLNNVVDTLIVAHNLEPFEETIARRQQEQMEREQAEAEQLATQEQEAQMKEEEMTSQESAQGPTQGKSPGTEANGIDMRNQPQQRPPRRETMK